MARGGGGGGGRSHEKVIMKCHSFEVTTDDDALTPLISPGLH